MTAVKYSQKNSRSFDSLMCQVRQCTLCQQHLPFPPRPVLAVPRDAKIVLIGQAPGVKAHESSTPWNDASGNRLRDWLGISKETFYESGHLALMPMGFCFPGYLKGADAPPRKECAPAWHDKLLSHLQPQMTILVGRYAQHYYLPQYRTLTAAIEAQFSTPQGYFVLPHPSGRNNRWLTRHPWFEADILPAIRQRVQALIEVPD